MPLIGFYIIKLKSKYERTNQGAILNPLAHALKNLLPHGNTMTLGIVYFTQQVGHWPLLKLSTGPNMASFCLFPSFCQH